MNGANLLPYLGTAVTTLISAGIGAYFGAYLKRKGENLATHEDLDKLVEQMEAVTKTQENIKAAISDEVWDRQKQWEMRRDIVFEVIRALGQYDNALLELCVAYSVPIAHVDSVTTDRLEKGDNWSRIGANLDSTGFLVRAFVSETLFKTLSACVIGMRTVAKEILNGKPERYADSKVERTNQINAVCEAVRKELKIKIAA